MIDKKFMIKKLQEEIKDKKDFFDFLEIKLEKEQDNKNNNENLIMDTMRTLLCLQVEIEVYNDLIKKIKKGKFDNKNLLN
ncbi:hypothetical protein [Spiroplasma endosymbiont of Amphimallon solstitiale]|uniref:hypothetical protein n=1 Tax=Spiroplasma endosymbiont of Amphimallon solstitiale TaxID=3066288 RepID=UPI00313BC8DA